MLPRCLNRLVVNLLKDLLNRQLQLGFGLNHGRSGVNRRPVSRLRDALLVGAGAREPRFLRNLHLAKRLVGRLAVRGAKLQVGNVRDPAFVLRAPKQVDVVLAHISHRELSRFLPPNQATGGFDKPWPVRCGRVAG